MKIGIIGERNNIISYSMLKNCNSCKDVEIVWFVDAGISKSKKNKLYGDSFDFGLIYNIFVRVSNLFYSLLKSNLSSMNCKKYCKINQIPYIIPKENSINSGLPVNMYSEKEADYVLIAGCDQILDENGLQLAKFETINYHYSPLPAYRGKMALFWQYYNHEPYIGYTFHKVNLGVDTGTPYLQGKVDYDMNESLGQVTTKVIDESSRKVCKLFELIKNDKKIVLFSDKISSYYPSKKYHELVMINNLKTVEEVISLYKVFGYIRLKNSLNLYNIKNVEYVRIDKTKLSWDGIHIPLADGHIVATVSKKVPFYIYRLYFGTKLLPS